MTRGEKTATDAPPQRFSLRVDGHTYALETSGRLTTTMRLLVDGEEVGSDSESGDRGRVTSADGSTRVEILRTSMGRVRRATLKLDGSDGDDRELDLDPEPGSPAALRLERERAHPVRSAARDVVLAALGVLLPLLGLGAIASVVTTPVRAWMHEHLPQVRVPQIPWERIPLPHLDFSWLPEMAEPTWVDPVFDVLDYAWPAIVAAAGAAYEIRRRRRQDALKATLADDESTIGQAESDRRGMPEQPPR